MEGFGLLALELVYSRLIALIPFMGLIYSLFHSFSFHLFVFFLILHLEEHLAVSGGTRRLKIEEQEQSRAGWKVETALKKGDWGGNRIPKPELGPRQTAFFCLSEPWSLWFGYQIGAKSKKLSRKRIAALRLGQLQPLTSLAPARVRFAY